MTNDTYQQQRQEGARLIVQKGNELAQHHDIKLDKIEWNGGQPIARRTGHVLAATANDKTVTAEFPDEWLADYPGRAGTEKANAVLSEIMRQLR